METAVYRHFDANGRLLYIGMTDSPARRAEQHAFDKPWWPDVTATTLEWHPTREAAAEAEVLAIKAEDPLHNRLHSPSYRRPIAPGVPLTLLKQRFESFMSRVFDDGDVLLITKNGRAAAALVPVEVAERYEAERSASSDS